MNNNQLEQLSVLTQNIVDKDYATPYLVIYPRHPNRRALISHLLREFDANIFYFALSNKIDSTRNFLYEFANSPQFPQNFTDSIHSALENAHDVNGWAEAVGSALDKLEKSSYTLVLDNLDIVQYDDNYSDFFISLARYIPSQAQIVINGREMNRHPWIQLVEENVASVAGENTLVGNGSLFNTPSNIGNIEFYALSGETRVLSDGFQVHTWDGALPRNMCYYFIENERVTRQQIFETFWGHLGVKEATNVFHVTKRKISEKLGYDITTYSGGFYVPSNTVELYYDARELEQTYNEALRSPGLATANKWARIVELYRRPYLLEVDMPWADNKREQLSDYYIQALLELGRFYEGNQNYDNALNYYLRAVAEKPEREDVHRNVMNIYHEQGNTGAIVNQYKILEKALKSSLNIRPSQATQSFYAEITGKK